MAGTAPLRLSDFRITPPEFLFIRIHHHIPGSVAMAWQRHS
ncbi:MAG: hypothetical protein ACRD2E_10915 [Terriglobales bacterium]